MKETSMCYKKFWLEPIRRVNHEWDSRPGENGRRVVIKEEKMREWT